MYAFKLLTDRVKFQIRLIALEFDAKDAEKTRCGIDQPRGADPSSSCAAAVSAGENDRASL